MFWVLQARDATLTFQTFHSHAAPAAPCGTAAPPARTPTGRRAGTAGCARQWARRGGQPRRRRRRQRWGQGRSELDAQMLACSCMLAHLKCMALCLHSGSSECNATRSLDAGGTFLGCISVSAAGWMGCNAGRRMCMQFRASAHVWRFSRRLEWLPPRPAGAAAAGRAQRQQQGHAVRRSVAAAASIGPTCIQLVAGRRRRRPAELAAARRSAGGPRNRAWGRSVRMGCNIDKVGGQGSVGGPAMSLPMIELRLGQPPGGQRPLRPRFDNILTTLQRAKPAACCLPPPAAAAVPPVCRSCPPLRLCLALLPLTQMLIKGIRSFSPDNQNVRHSRRGPQQRAALQGLRLASAACLLPGAWLPADREGARARGMFLTRIT